MINSESGRHPLKINCTLNVFTKTKFRQLHVYKNCFQTDAGRWQLGSQIQAAVYLWTAYGADDEKSNFQTRQVWVAGTVAELNLSDRSVRWVVCVQDCAKCTDVSRLNKQQNSSGKGCLGHQDSKLGVSEYTKAVLVVRIRTQRLSWSSRYGISNLKVHKRNCYEGGSDDLLSNTDCELCPGFQNIELHLVCVFLVFKVRPNTLVGKYRIASRE